MASTKKQEKKPTKAVATPKVKTTEHIVLVSRFGFKKGQKIELDDSGIVFYRNRKIIK